MGKPAGQVGPVECCYRLSGVGDPSCDLAIAWTPFERESRKAFRAAIRLGHMARGRGWRLWKALITLAGHIETNPWKRSLPGA